MPPGGNTAAARTGSVPSRVLRRHQVPHLRECDPLTGALIRSSKATSLRYEKDHQGEVIHMDVKKIGKIPDGGGWKPRGDNLGWPACPCSS